MGVRSSSKTWCYKRFPNHHYKTIQNHNSYSRTMTHSSPDLCTHKIIFALVSHLINEMRSSLVFECINIWILFSQRSRTPMKTLNWSVVQKLRSKLYLNQSSIAWNHVYHYDIRKRMAFSLRKDQCSKR